MVRITLLMRKNFKRQISSLSKIFDFVGDILAQYEVEESISFAVKLAIEELFTNTVKYNRDSNSDLTVEIEKKGKYLIVNLIDSDCEEFDLKKIKEVDITKKLDERKIGGLGLHLVKKMVDNLEYEYSNRKSKITFTKYLGIANVQH
jgi:anti-sigma regulatory factor (Ser/Thr protein kinase)